MIPTITFTLFIAGSYDDAVRACREFCAAEGACFAIAPTCYVYTGGAEDGVAVTLINYPRFPSTEAELAKKMTRLAEHLRTRLFQHSYTIQGPTQTVWDTLRVST